MSGKAEVDEQDRDWYAILGCDLKSTKTVIEKAARKLSLKYHPDKTSDEKAAELFLLVQKAKEILLDDEKRKVIDEKIRLVSKRKEYDENRSKTMDSRRKKMKEDLDTRLKQQQNPNQAQNVQRYQQEQQQKQEESNIDRLRKEGAIFRETAALEAERKEAARLREILRQRASLERQNLGSKAGPRQIKVKWKRTRHNHSDESLYNEFKTFGDIEDVALTGTKGNSALITFAGEGSAEKAVEAFGASEEYRVTLLSDDVDGSKKAAVFTHEYTSQHKGSVLFQAPGTACGNGKESDLMKEMRRAVEREEILRSLGEPLGAQEGTHSHNHDTSVHQHQHRTNHPRANHHEGGSVHHIQHEKKTYDSHGSDNKGGKIGGGQDIAPNASSMASKEADILRRMMEAAAKRKV